MVTLGAMLTSPFASLTSPSLGHEAAWDALTDIDRLLRRDGLPDAAVASGIRHILADRLPPLSSPLEWPPGRLWPGATPADAAGYISGLLKWHPGPATALFAQIAGGAVTIEVAWAADRWLEAGDDYGPLEAPPGTPVYERGGRLSAGKVSAADTRLLLIPDRIPPDAMKAIRSGRPAGEVLETYGMRRGRRDVIVSRAEATVDASAVLYLADTPIGASGEHVPAVFCRHVAALAC
jgi:hypothetical protein